MEMDEVKHHRAKGPVFMDGSIRLRKHSDGELAFGVVFTKPVQVTDVVASQEEVANCRFARAAWNACDAANLTDPECQIPDLIKGYNNLLAIVRNLHEGQRVSRKLLAEICETYHDFKP